MVLKYVRHTLTETYERSRIRYLVVARFSSSGSFSTGSWSTRWLCLAVRRRFFFRCSFLKNRSKCIPAQIKYSTHHKRLLLWRCFLRFRRQHRQFNFLKIKKSLKSSNNEKNAYVCIVSVWSGRLRSLLASANDSTNVAQLFVLRL